MIIVNSNRKRFIKLRKIFALAGILTFCIAFLIHRSVDPFVALVIGILLGSFVFVIGFIVTAIMLAAPGTLKITPLIEFPSDELTLDKDRLLQQPYNIWDHWQNDVTNPASPTYQAYHSTHRDY